jgi:hypothetical protein
MTPDLVITYFYGYGHASIFIFIVGFLFYSTYFEF